MSASAPTHGQAAGGPLATDTALLGAWVLRLAANFPEWVRRRKTTYVFVDETTVLHRQSIDLFLPERDWFPGAPPRAGQTIYVPLIVLAKETLSAFSVTDASGSAVSVLNTAENGTLAAEGFNAFINGETSAHPSVAEDAFAPVLERIVTAPDVARGEAAFVQAMEEGLNEWLGDDDQYRALLGDLRGGFLLLTPVTYQPGTNLLFKLEWAAPFTWAEGSLGGWLRAAGASLGLFNKKLQFEELPIGWAQGTHFEVTQPNNTRLIESVLSVDQHETGGGRIAIPRRRVVTGKPQADVNVSPRDKNDLVAARADIASLTLRFRPRRGGAFMAIAVVSTLTAALLWALEARLAQLDAQTTAAGILVLPALLAAYLAREGEHAVAGRLLSGVRAAGLAVALIAFATAIIIGVGSLRETPAPTARLFGCDARSEATGTQRRPTVTLRELRCRAPAARTPSPRANQTLQTALRWLAGLATLIAAMPLLGLYSTHRETVSARQRGDESNSM